MLDLRIFLVFCGSTLLMLGQGINPLSISRVNPNQFQLSWFANYLRPYQFEASPDLVSWADFGAPIVGTGVTRNLLVQKTAEKMFFRLREGAIRPGFDGISMSRWDDHSYPQYAVPNVQGSAVAVPLGFQINFFGQLYSSCYVNNNGNISFGAPYQIYTPSPLSNLGEKIIAPFWADVDTLNVLSNVTKFTSGNETVDNRPAFGVTYRNVGFFSAKANKLNSFQIIIIQRFDTGVNNFDIEFNYDKVTWETGDSSGGDFYGLGGDSARAGLTNGGSFSAEIDGSGVNSAFLDTNLTTGTPNYSTGLIYNFYNTSIPGRFVFPVRGGLLELTFGVNAGPDQTLTENHSATFQLNGSVSPPGFPGLSYKWIQKDGNPPVAFSNSTILNPNVTITEPGNYEFELSATTTGLVKFSARDLVTISHPGTFTVYAGDSIDLMPPASLTQTLHGSATFSGGVGVGVHWTQTYGNAAVISNPNILEPTVTLPGPGYYEFTITGTTLHDSPFIQSSVTAIYYI